MTQSRHPERRMLVAADIERYSRQDNLLQCQTQERFRLTMTQAAQRLGLDRVHWITQQGGDGELAILPAHTPEPPVVASLASTMDLLLREYNRHVQPAARVRIRLALHVGLVHLDGANGFPGAAVVDVCRLVDAPLLKQALRAYPSASVVQIVSEQVYGDIVRNRYEGIRPERYVRVVADLPEKGFRETAWITIPGEDVGPLVDVVSVVPVGDATPPNQGATSPVAGAGSAAGAGTAVPAPPPGASTFNFGTVTTLGPAAFGDHSQASNG